MTENGAQIKTAVVGVDFSEGSRQAIKAAAFLQRAGGLDVAIHHTIDEDGMADLVDAVGLPKSEVVDDLKAKAVEMIEGWATAAGFAATPKTLISQGPPAKDILSVAADYDLLILGERGESHPSRGLGTVAAHCVRKHRGRVLLVENERDPVEFGKVVACVDFTPASEAVVQEAAALAKVMGTSITCLHVYRAPWEQLHYRAPTAAASPHFRREFMTVMEKRMTDLLQGAGLDPETVEHAFFKSTSYGFGIVDFAKRERADLVVLGTHGRKSLKELYLGSTAERLLRELPCSVMTVRTG